MIEVDISNIWGRVSLPELLAVESEISAAHMALSAGTLRTDTAPWLEAARRIRENSRVLVVIGMGDSFLEARAAVELLRGPEYNLCGGDVQIFFTGDSLSSRSHRALLRLLEGKDFSLCVISEEGDGLEPSVEFRSLRWLLERRYGTDEARGRIWAVTDTPGGTLGQLAESEGWELFPIPRRSGLGALLPMAAAQIDIDRLLRGMEEAAEEYNLRSFENPLWLYAASRCLLQRKGCAVELLGLSEPGCGMLGRWWRQLFGGAGPVPIAVRRQELDRLAGERTLFETLLCFEAPEMQVTVGEAVKDPEGLNALAGRGLEDVDAQLTRDMAENHADRGIPVITIGCGAPEEGEVGALLTFFRLGSALCRQITENGG